MYVLTLLCFLRDCMKGDETENKKIGCTVNLMVKIFPLSLCDTVQRCWNWDRKGWDRNLCQASAASESEHWGDRTEWQGLWGSYGGLWSNFVLREGPNRSGSSGPFPAEFCVSLWQCVLQPPLPFLSAFPYLHYEKKSWHDKISGLNQYEYENNYYFCFALIMYSLFNTFIHTQMLLIVLNEGSLNKGNNSLFFFNRISINLKLTRKRCTSAISTSCVTCTYRLRTTQVSKTSYGVC